MSKLTFSEWTAEQTKPKYQVYLISGKHHWKKEFMNSLKELYKCDYKLVNKDIREHLKNMNYRPLKQKKHLLMFESLGRLTEKDLNEIVGYIRNPSKFGIFVLSIQDWEEKRRVTMNFRHLDKSEKVKFFQLDFPSQDFIRSYIQKISDDLKINYDNKETFNFLYRRIASSTEEIYNNIETLSSFTKEVTKEDVKEYTEDYSTYNYSKLYESLVELNRVKVPYISYNDLLESGRKDITIMINIKKHFELLYQAKFLKVKGYLRNRDMIEVKKGIFDKHGLKFNEYNNIWNEPKYKINQLLESSDKITLKEIIWVINKIDSNLKAIGNMKKGKLEGYESEEKIYKTLLEILDRRY